MRLLGLVITLGIIGWVLYTGSGGSESEGVVPEGYEQSMDKARDVEQTINDAAKGRLEKLDSDS